MDTQEWLEKVKQTVIDHPEYLDENLGFADKVRREAAVDANRLDKMGLHDTAKLRQDQSLKMHAAYEVLNEVKRNTQE